MSITEKRGDGSLGADGQYKKREKREIALISRRAAVASFHGAIAQRPVPRKPWALRSRYVLWPMLAGGLIEHIGLPVRFVSDGERQNPLWGSPGNRTSQRNRVLLIFLPIRLKSRHLNDGRSAKTVGRADRDRQPEAHHIYCRPNHRKIFCHINQRQLGHGFSGHYHCYRQVYSYRRFHHARARR